jgi:hypothetical protein
MTNFNLEGLTYGELLDIVDKAHAQQGYALNSIQRDHAPISTPKLNYFFKSVVGPYELVKAMELAEDRLIRGITR